MPKQATISPGQPRPEAAIRSKPATIIQLLGNVVHLVIQPMRRIYMEPVEGRTDGELHVEDVTEKMVGSYFTRVAAAKIPDWLESFSQSDERCRQEIAQIWRYSRFIDSEILGLISQFELSEYSRSLQVFRKIPTFRSGANLGYLTTPYFWYFEAAMRLSTLTGQLRARYAMAATFVAP
jgi:hypothetical protein